MAVVLPPRVDVLLDEDELAAEMRREAAEGLGRTPKELQPKWFYDDVGCALFGAITCLGDYYLTRCEREILTAEAGSLARLAGADTLVELGPGSGEKTQILLDGLAREGSLRAFVPFDVSEPDVRRLCASVAERHPGVEIHGVVGDFERHLGHVPGGGRRLVALLGSTIGNLLPAQRASFLSGVAGLLGPDDHLLVGIDLVKSPELLLRAYDDAAGVTAAFNRNILAVLNRALDGDFDLRSFDHVARWDADGEWIEMHLRSTRDQQVRLCALDVVIELRRDELVRTEVSAKFRREGFEEELTAVGLAPLGLWTDRQERFGLVLARPA